MARFARVGCAVVIVLGLVVVWAVFGPKHPELQLTLENHRQVPVCNVVVDTRVPNGRAWVGEISGGAEAHATVEVHSHRHLSVAASDCEGNVTVSTFDPYFMAHEGFPDVYTVVFDDGPTHLSDGTRSLEDRGLGAFVAHDVDAGAP